MSFYSQFEFLINTICFRSISEKKKNRINELDVTLRNAIIKLLEGYTIKRYWRKHFNLFELLKSTRN